MMASMAIISQMALAASRLAYQRKSGMAAAAHLACISAEKQAAMAKASMSRHHQHRKQRGLGIS